MQSNRIATTYPQCANRAQLQDEAQPRADTSSAPDNPHLGSKERPRQLSGTQLRATSLCDEAYNASCTSRNGTSRYRNQSQAAYRSDAQSRCTISKLQDKELYNSLIALLMLRLHASGPRMGYTTAVWNTYVRYLGAPMVYRGIGPLMERFERAEPPKGGAQGTW
jgi:hypothetical protein